MSYGVVFCLRFFGLILSAITTVFTVILWSELPQDNWTSFLMGLAGFALEGCKFLLLILAVVFYRDRLYFAALSSGILAALLFVVSIGASVGFLEKSEQQQRQQSWQGQQIQKQSNQLHDEILLLTESARRDVASGYRERALETQSRIDDLREQQNQLQSEPLAMVADSSFSGLAGLLGMANQQTRLIAWLVLALLIDSVAGACWVFLALLKQSETGVDNKEPLSSKSQTGQGLEPLSEMVEMVSDMVGEIKVQQAYGCSSVASVVVDDPQDELFMVVSEKIANNVPGYDESMSLNSLMRLESIGYAKARKVMDRIEAEQKQV